MQNIQWYVSRISGIDPDTPDEPERSVRVRVRYESERGHTAGHDFEFLIPAALRDLDAIEREAYLQLREHLTALG